MVTSRGFFITTWSDVLRVPPCACDFSVATEGRTALIYSVATFIVHLCAARRERRCPSLLDRPKFRLAGELHPLVQNFLTVVQLFVVFND